MIFKKPAHFKHQTVSASDVYLNTDFHGLKGFPQIILKGVLSIYSAFQLKKRNPFNPFTPWKSVFK